MLCRWLLLGPAWSVAAVAVALVITPAGPAWLCRVVTICHRCI
jgi:hypothetical protein